MTIGAISGFKGFNSQERQEAPNCQSLVQLPPPDGFTILGTEGRSGARSQDAVNSWYSYSTCGLYLI